MAVHAEANAVIARAASSCRLRIFPRHSAVSHSASQRMTVEALEIQLPAQQQLFKLSPLRQGATGGTPAGSVSRRARMRTSPVPGSALADDRVAAQCHSSPKKSWHSAEQLAVEVVGVREHLRPRAAAAAAAAAPGRVHADRPHAAAAAAIKP